MSYRGISINNLPLQLQQRGFYYGWVILVVGTLGVVMSVPGQTVGVSVYTDHLIQSLQISRSNLSLAYMLGTLASSLLLPYAGRLLDRLGARVLGVIACLGLAGALCLLAITPTMQAALVNRFGWPMSETAIGLTFVLFLAIRQFGQGQLTLASRTMLGLWFERRRGLVLGISGTFSAFGFGVAPLVMTNLITSWEWQPSLYVLAVAMATMAAVACLTFRRSPEHSGLKIDGGIVKEQDSTSDPEETWTGDQSFTASEAKSTFTFWAFNMGMVVQALVVTAITFHMAAIGRHFDMTQAQAFGVYLPISIVAILSQLLGGYLADRINLKYLLMLMQGGLGIGLLGFQWFDHPVGFAIAAIGLGIGSGQFSLLSSAAWPKLFGRRYLGSINGINTAWMVSGNAVGPYMFSLGEEMTGDYIGVVYLSILLPAAVLVAAWFADPPQRVAPKS